MLIRLVARQKREKQCLELVGQGFYVFEEQCAACRMVPCAEQVVTVDPAFRSPCRCRPTLNGDKRSAAACALSMNEVCDASFANAIFS
jgi:hypothetical protein